MIDSTFLLMLSGPVVAFVAAMGVYFYADWHNRRWRAAQTEPKSVKPAE